jgi:hypothetical protein
MVKPLSVSNMFSQKKPSPISKLDAYGTATVIIAQVFAKKLNQCNAITGFQD